ncbi:3-[(3aS,4S,7aS)-7a-methyl-1,5-dioxo-octahydro-1H-inden-4-yl]propanoyl:CoA ligase [Halioglobus japonicus]|nr:3-[(3aS,4S,7aS)-7a-methyl-1,5-dioxo-octahydro-1H-inden-4-yl]propanoyl:CoA ligase [Halioglobus japonicus]
MAVLLNPVPWQTIPQMLRDSCQRYPQGAAVIDGDVTLSYAELGAKVEQCANAMTHHGVKPEDLVCIWAPNSWQWIVCAFACWQLGAVVVPVSSRLKAREVGPVLQRTGARLLFSVQDCAGTDLPLLLASHYGHHDERPVDELLALEQVICFDQPSDLARCCSYAAFLEIEGSAAVATAPGPGDRLAEILFTSGTTGEPKGVVLNQQQVLQAFWDWSDLGGLNEHDNFLVIPPFSHGFGINAGILACVMRGMTHVVVDFFDPDAALELIQKHAVSVMSGPPALFTALARKVAAPGKVNACSTLRVAYVGAAHVPEDTISLMQTTLGIQRVINAYGLIEACVVAMTRADDSNTTISKTVGRALPNVELRIVDDGNRELPSGEPGEVLVRSYGVMQGYFAAPELTATVLTEDQWLHTGDIGVLDEAGNLTLVGRKKELFICNGFNVYPSEVEDLLLQHPDIMQAAVVGISHAEKGEVGVAFIVGASSSSSVDESTLIHWARENMAAYKVPLHILPVDQLPLNANGKVRKDELTQRAIQHSN